MSNGMSFLLIRCAEAGYARTSAHCRPWRTLRETTSESSSFSLVWLQVSYPSPCTPLHSAICSALLAVYTLLFMSCLVLLFPRNTDPGFIVPAMTAIFASYAAKLYNDASTARQYYTAFKLGCCAGICGLIFFTFLTSIRYGTQFQ